MYCEAIDESGAASRGASRAHGAPPTLCANGTAALHGTAIETLHLERASDLKFARWNKADEALTNHAASDLSGKNEYDDFRKERTEFVELPVET